MLINKSFILLFFVFFLLSGFVLSAQQPDIVDNQLKNISLNFKKFSTLVDEKDIVSLAMNIDSNLISILDVPGSFEYDFSVLNNNVSILVSDDGLFRIFTWNIFYGVRGFHYFGYVQYLDKATGEYNFFVLKDQSGNIKRPEKGVLKAKRWYGCLYYELITNSIGRYKFYTLLGWDGNNELTSKKLIEVVTVKNSGLRFGYDFEFEGKKVDRIIFEYSNKTQMSLRWNDDLGMIVWDHLSPIRAGYEGIYQYYGPDFTYDGLIFKNKRWEFLSDIEVNNEE